VSDIKARVIRGSIWISIARGTTNLLSALSTIVLAQLLLPTDFGLVALAVSMLVVLDAFTELSLSQALIHTRDPTPGHYNTAWSLGLARGLLIGLGFAAAAPLIASAYGEPRLKEVMFALAISAVTGGLQNPKLVMFQKQLRFHQQAILGIASTLMNVIVSIVIAVIFRSYWALIAGLLAGQITNVILSYTMFPFRPSLSWKHFGELWRFSVWVSLGQIINTLNYRFDHLLVGTFLGRADLGLYHVGSRLAVLPGREIVRPLTGTLFPAFSLAADDPERLRRAYQRVQGLVTAIALPASIGFGLIADPLVRLALGEKWLGAIPVVQLVAAIYSIDTFGSLVVPLGMAKGETRQLFVRTLQKLAIRVPIIVAGLALGGFAGLLYGRMIAGAAGVVVDMATIDRLAGISLMEQFRSNMRAILSTIGMVLSVILLRISVTFPANSEGLLVGLFATIILAVFVYVATSWLLWRLAGRPKGPETEVIDAGAKALRAFRRKWATLP
jgi:O-antigen/teichoic acid export membrane protein